MSNTPFVQVPIRYRIDDSATRIGGMQVPYAIINLETESMGMVWLGEQPGLIEGLATPLYPGASLTWLHPGDFYAKCDMGMTCEIMLVKDIADWQGNPMAIGHAVADALFPVIQSQLGLYLPLTGGELSGPLNIDGTLGVNGLISTAVGMAMSLSEPTASNHATPKAYVDSEINDLSDALQALINNRVLRAGDTMTGVLASANVQEAFSVNTGGGAYGYIGFYHGGTRVSWFGKDTAGTPSWYSDVGSMIIGAATELVIAGSNMPVRRNVSQGGSGGYKAGDAINSAGHWCRGDGAIVSALTAANSSTLSSSNLSLTRCATPVSDAGGIFITFRRTAGNDPSTGLQVGSVTVAAGGSQVVYNVSSDEDTKDIIGPVNDNQAEQIMLAIEPIMYRPKIAPELKPICGYSAQQVAQAWPNAIDSGVVTKPAIPDPESDDPNEIATGWMIDHSKLVPILHAGWQATTRKLNKAMDRIASLEARLDALEAA